MPMLLPSRQYISISDGCDVNSPLTKDSGGQGNGVLVKNVFLVFLLFLTGCNSLDKLLGIGGGGGTPKNAIVSGAYTVVATSTKSNTLTNVYINVAMQSGTSLAGTSNTLVCLENVVTNCIGNDPPASAVTFVGTVSGNSVQINLSFPDTQGTDTISLTGVVSGTSISGTYTDSQGDAGTWTATQSSSPAGTLSGTINSTLNPLTIPPKITLVIVGGQNSALTGTATLQNWTCFTSLNLSGLSIGGAFTLSDSTNDVLILAVPSATATFNVAYQVGSSVSSCAGDHGTGTLTIQ
jgi:hypothetical protein